MGIFLCLPKAIFEKVPPERITLGTLRFEDSPIPLFHGCFQISYFNIFPTASAPFFHLFDDRSIP